MKDIRIKIDSTNSMVFPDTDIAGINYENLQGNIIFYFDEFIDGIAWLEIERQDGTKGYLEMAKDGEEYKLSILSSLLQDTGLIYMQLRITEAEDINGIPVFKSKKFYLKVLESINSTETIPEQYPNWIDTANAQLIEFRETEDYVLAKVEEQKLNADLTLQYQTTTQGYMNTTEGYKDLAYDYKEEAKTSEANAGLEADRATNNILNGVSTHNQDVTAHSSLIEDIRTVEAIARGRATGYVFDTYQDMLDWLDIPENVEKLIVGDNLYIRDIGVKDYWWDGETYQELEAESPDLTNYYTKIQVDSKMPILITRDDYNGLVSAGTVQADRTYDIIEEV